MYAVIVTGGKQYKVAKDEIIRVEKLNAEIGETIVFDQLLMAGEGEQLTLGTPFIKGAKVSATVVEQGRGKKITVLKFRRRKQYLKRQGHRQDFTELQIVGFDGIK